MDTPTGSPAAESIASKLRRPPQITLALDAQTRVLYVNRDLAGASFAELTEDGNARLHELLHPQCDGACRLKEQFRKVWDTYTKNLESIEWELEDTVRQAHLRLSLNRPPTATGVEVDRRRRFALLTVTDITEIRREYLAVVASNEALQQQVAELVNGADKKNGVLSPAASPEAGELSSGDLNAQIIAAQETERRRIAADLHDGIAQTIGGLKFGVESRLADLQRRHPDIDLGEFEPIIAQIREALDDLRKISRNLSPSVLNEFGVCTAINMLCNDFDGDIPSVKVGCAACISEIGLHDNLKLSIYRVVQEALNNARKHAAAQKVRVNLTEDEKGLLLEITDDGQGFDPDAPAQRSPVDGGLGLDSMRERVEFTGGKFRIDSEPGQGTTIRASWPRSSL